jgi:hypothetical protein
MTDCARAAANEGFQLSSAGGTPQRRKRETMTNTKIITHASKPGKNEFT